MELFKEFNFLPAILDDFKLPMSPQFLIKSFDHCTVLTESSIKKFEDCGLGLRELQLFVTPPYSVGTLHIDGHSLNPDSGCVNFVLNDYRNWTMEWYESEINAPLEFKTSKGNTLYLTSNISTCTLLVKYNFRNCCALRIGIPHRVINSGPEIRYTISIRFKNNNYNNICERLNEYYATS